MFCGGREDGIFHRSLENVADCILSQSYNGQSHVKYSEKSYSKNNHLTFLNLVFLYFYWFSTISFSFPHVTAINQNVTNHGRHFGRGKIITPLKIMHIHICECMYICLYELYIYLKSDELINITILHIFKEEGVIRKLYAQGFPL